MKTLELQEMEKSIGGNCSNNLEDAALGVSGAGVIYSVAFVAAAATPVGWAALAITATSFAISAYQC
jgi:hypothetical protein